MILATAGAEHSRIHSAGSRVHALSRWYDMQIKQHEKFIVEMEDGSKWRHDEQFPRD